MANTSSFEDLKYRKKEGKIIPRKTTLSQEVKKSILILIATLLGIIVLLSIVFLMNTSQATQKGYILQQQQLDKENFLESKAFTGCFGMLYFFGCMNVYQRSA